MPRLGITAGVAFALIAAPALGAEDAGPKRDLALALEDIARMQADYQSRIETLEAQVSQLRDVEAGPDHGSHSGGFRAPRLSIRGFAHVGYNATESSTRAAPIEESSNHFDTEGFSLILSSDISERVSFFSETEFDLTGSGSTSITIARMKLNVDLFDGLRMTLGKGHTAIGYWNKNYHHGAWVDPTISRPLIYNYEGSGGVLPLHYYGVELMGDFSSGLGNVSYVATLANGNGPTTTSTPVQDRNDSKLLALLMTWEPREDAGLGFNVVLDRIPGDPAIGPFRDHTIEELIYGGHLFYRVEPFDFVTEFQHITHEDGGTGASYRHYGAFAHLGYTLGKFTPYYRFDLLGIESGDPFFVGSGAVLARLSDTVQHSVGVRWDIKPFVAIKTEYRYRRDRFQRDSTAAVQAAFTF